jgi:hypothetical protein
MLPALVSIDMNATITQRGRCEGRKPFGS